MGVPMFDIGYNLGPQERAALLQRFAAVLEHGRFLNGPELGELEERLAAFLGVPHAIACSNGSDALVLALRAADVGPGDEVVLPAFTFFATAGAVARLGATPVFADVEPHSLLLDRQSAASKCGPRTKAVLPVHLFGMAAPIAPLRAAVEAAAGHPVAVVEDAAQAIGAAAPEGPIGGLGLVAAWSCFPTKNLGACGDAGFVTTTDAGRAARIRRLREHGGGQQYHHDEVGYNFRLDSLQAAALSERLPQLPAWNAAREESARHYGELLEKHGLAGCVQPPPHVAGRIYHQYVVRAARRDALRAALTAAGIGSAVYYPVPLHLQPCFAGLGGRPGDLPESERAAQEVLALPIHPGVRPEQREEVIEGFAAFYRGASMPVR
ncbi:MAG TPA: DegT/DnrJ/EryC1/StrS family aminotransferase [Planctomycetota bacterium]